MGELSGQGIEPVQQQELADATEGVTGVLCAGVPGAGGIDAMFAIIFTGIENGEVSLVRSNVEQLWSTWSLSDSTKPDVCALTLDAESGNKSGIFLEH